MTKNKWEERPIGVDLFAGAGGMTLGFEQAGFDVLASVELDPIHCATHEFNFPFWSILCHSATEITAEEIRNNSSIKNRDIDVVFGGPPCQGFSLIGKRTLDDPRNSLMFDFIRLVLELKPKFFVLENVPGLAIGEHRKFLIEIISKFRNNCYEIEEKYQVLNAAHYGVPQQRTRLFIIGCREGLSLPKYPQPLTQASTYNTNSGQGKSESTDIDQLPFSPTVDDAIRDLPELENYPELWKKDWAIVEYGEASNYVKQLRGICPLEDDYSYGREYNLQMLTSSLRTAHTAQTTARFKETLPGKIEKISRFFKLHPEGICNTLRAGTSGNRGAFTSPRPIHPFTPRCITVREAARLHSYPDWFRFHVTKWHGFRQIGNSVPPLLAKAIAAEIIRTLGVTPLKPNLRQKLGEEKLLQLKMSQAAKYYGVDPQVIEKS
ncbi:MAG: DNA cytosine methyltransferase [Symploca sp. SIO3C6]|nr:DNA cytosine methyltransferase [Symploca sp. SIO3C6]